jgi:hypothetical protein
MIPKSKSTKVSVARAGNRFGKEFENHLKAKRGRKAVLRDRYVAASKGTK